MDLPDAPRRPPRRARRLSEVALMAGMMGGMPSGMIGGMMAVMGLPAIGLSVGAGLLLGALFWALAVRGRYRFER